MTTITAPTAPPQYHVGEARMKNPARHLPGVIEQFMALGTVAQGHGVPPETLELVHLRTSQINGCAACSDFGVKHALATGESAERLIAVATWREARCFTEAERAALALAEAMTRIADSSDPVPDAVWAEATRHFDAEAISALVVHIGVANFYNRINVTIRTVPGTIG